MDDLVDDLVDDSLSSAEWNYSTSHWEKKAQFLNFECLNKSNCVLNFWKMYEWAPHLNFCHITNLFHKCIMIHLMLHFWACSESCSPPADISNAAAYFLRIQDTSASVFCRQLCGVHYINAYSHRSLRHLTVQLGSFPNEKVQLHLISFGPAEVEGSLSALSDVVRLECAGFSWGHSAVISVSSYMTSELRDSGAKVVSLLSGFWSEHFSFLGNLVKWRL